MAIFIAESSRQSIRSQAVDGQWTTITLTPPAGAIGVVVEFRGPTDTNNAQGAVRTIGCGIDGNAAYQIGDKGATNMQSMSQHWAGLNGSDQVEIWTNQYCTEARIAGWLEAGDITFLPACVDMWDYLETGDQTTPNTDHTFDLSGISGGAGAVIIRCKGTGADGLATWAFKRPAETWGSDLLRGTNATEFILPLDAQGKTMLRFSHYQPTLIVLGFMGANFTAYTAPVSLNLVTNTWSDAVVPSTSETAIGAMIGHTNAADVWGGVINSTEAGQAPANAQFYGAQYFTGLSANKEYKHYNVDAAHGDMYTYAVGYFDPETTPTGPRIDQVNGDNVIDHAQIFQVKGAFPTVVTSVKLVENGRETVVPFGTQTGTTLECGPLDVFGGSARLGAVTIELSDGAETDTLDITAVSGSLFVDTELVDPILATGAVKELTVAAGQQLAISAGAGGSVNTLYPDSDTLLSPAAINGQVYERHHHDGTTWQSDTITLYRGSYSVPVWTGDLSPPNAVVGKPYSYNVGALLAGDRPMALTLVTGSLPDGISLNSTTELLEGTANVASAFTGLSIEAENTEAIQVVGNDV